MSVANKEAAASGRPPEKPGVDEAPAPSPEGEVKMTIWEHLGELRIRIMRASVGLIVSTIVAWIFRVEILAWLERPYEQAWRSHNLPGVPELINITPGGQFAGYLQLAMTAGVVASAPLIFYQLWAFISPGLYSKEKRLVVPFVLFSTALFLSGVAFGYYMAFPITLNYFFSLLGPISTGGAVLHAAHDLRGVPRLLDPDAARVRRNFLELPLFIAFLAIAAIVTPQQLLRFGRWAILASFILGAAISPGPDVLSRARSS